MRALVLLLAVAACHIPTEHFVKPSGDGGSGDGKKTDAPPDTPLTGTSNAYALDPQRGLFQVARDRATGALTLGTSVPTSAPAAIDSVTDPNGTHVYAILADSTAPKIQAFAIAADGSLTASTPIPFTNCYPQIAAMHPTGRWIAVGCSSAFVALVPITANGDLAAPIEMAAGISPSAASWSNDGKCAFFADPGASGSQPNVLAYAFDMVQQTLTPAGGVMGPPSSTAIATSPTASSVFVGGRGTSTANPGLVMQYTYGSGCTLSPLPTTNQIGLMAALAVVDPTGSTLYITDGGLWAFSIMPNGLAPYANNPYFPTSNIAFGVAIHPALPRIVYVSGYAYGGAIVVHNDGNGNLTQAQMLAVSPSTTFLQLEP